MENPMINSSQPNPWDTDDTYCEGCKKDNRELYIDRNENHIYCAECLSGMEEDMLSDWTKI